MKINVTKNSKLGMAMSEYLIVLAVVALGCICIFGLFGKQIKYTASRAAATLSGESADPKGNALPDANTAAGKKTGMVDFNNAGN
ncbi:MAG: hypothetical protein HY299_14295 [Verrucomicrobia bacterium]|nr:hypothetical protein [Verrucomicrobiota bacterium]